MKKAKNKRKVYYDKEGDFYYPITTYNLGGPDGGFLLVHHGYPHTLQQVQENGWEIVNREKPVWKECKIKKINRRGEFESVN